MIKVFFVSSEKNNYFGVNQVLLNLQKFLRGKCRITYSKSIYQFIVKDHDLIHFHGCWKFSHIIYFIISKLMNIKILISPHGMLDPYSMSQKRTFKLIFWHLFQKNIFLFSDQIIVNSLKEKKNVLKIVNHKNIQIIQHGIDLNLLNYKKVNNKNLFPRFVFFSRIHPSKNLHTLINLWTGDKFFKKFKLDIFGEVTDLDYYQLIHDKIFKSNNINFKGPIYKNKIRILSRYDIFIFPSKSENFGLVILEALASGLYLILNSKLPWHHLKKRDYASLINFNKKQLIYTIRKTILKKNKIKNYDYNQSKKLFIKKNYDWKNISDIYVKNYRKICNQN